MKLLKNWQSLLGFQMKVANVHLCRKNHSIHTLVSGLLETNCFTLYKKMRMNVKL